MTADRAAEPHPDVQRFLELYDSLETPSFDEVPVERARAMLEELQAGEPAIELESVTDRTIDGPNGEIPIRIYEPGAGEDNQRGRERDEEQEQEHEHEHQRPLILYFHGGGWVVGSIDSHDNTCRKLAADSGYPVVSVDYRLAPEHPFPAGLQDCYAALEWAAESAPELGADPDQIVLAGDSAGGNLAAGTALLARDQDGPAVAYQLLIYPATGDATETDSYEENGEGYFLTADEMAWFRGHYFDRPLDQGNVYAMPRRATDLSGLPPATIITAGFDPLRDDGEAYATRLEDAGVPVTRYNYDDLIHGFFGMITEPVAIERAHEAYDDAVGDLQSALDTDGTV
ncbi:alpha/beta hydrolase [Natrialba aegyptia]|uniref:Alpha/beta hydrolase fold-3 protein domain-containing protein n=1 Tax=Natrialba aegyptia DSM 13077 TaxID=1227491 RepID=M0B1Y5_9EURY|nr:alpha/beta hydrolase [Natrialba aegyptia]ELZ04537.1 alpha/beta hydrolase fold-3 protein domain-containing protein [Natrialba aegyptia DSM 13077]